ncbi:hypothetical protein SAMN04487905_103144 [Actinopolyspora xinjiangensis]|uniref:Uncharacterized protein n=1 Tax=Actinopolyspora xinjiangensis TaxID=405564 RepID=A0A1H0RMQ5_9ACTN|nr:hypothetical protein [Actinopolyspora xinjiangensis]SDP30680.1 hypothetical protein SAMN04487905_103144 [Actinopolyspora xinjiangensis]
MTALPPAPVPCLLTALGLRLTVHGITGAAAAAEELHELGFTEVRWRPALSGGNPTAPYAFVHVDGLVHLAWFRPWHHVESREPTACGRPFRPFGRGVLPLPPSHDVNGSCPVCLDL